MRKTSGVGLAGRSEQSPPFATAVSYKAPSHLRSPATPIHKAPGPREQPPWDNGVTRTEVSLGTFS